MASHKKKENSFFDLDWENAETIQDKKYGYVQKVYDRNRKEYIISKTVKKENIPDYSLEYPKYAIPKATPENHLAQFLGYGKITNVSVQFFWKYYNQNHLRDYANYYITTEEEAYSIFLEVVEAVYHLHTHSIVHMDIKEKNIFVENHHAYLGDFGFCRKRSPSARSKGYTGTISHVSPEMCYNRIADKEDRNLIDLYKQDAWTLGVVYYYLLFKKYPHPFPKKDDTGTICKNKKEPVRIPPKKISTFSRKILERLLEFSQEKRITVISLYENILMKPNVYFLREKIHSRPEYANITFLQLESCILPIFNKYKSVIKDNHITTLFGYLI